MAAHSTAMKNRTANSCPNGICWKTEGSVMNMSAGPEAKSTSNANTAGTTTSAAKSAAQMLKNVTLTAELTTSTSFFR